MRVGFRVDASVQIGTGHVMRCLTLADALADAGAECLFVSRSAKGNLHELIKGRGHRQIVLPQATRPVAVLADDPPHAAWLEADWREDAQQTLAALADEPRLDWLAVDHYALDSRWHRMLGSVADRLLVIDDVADRSLDCDILLDQNLQVSDDRYAGLTGPNTRQLLGPRYALLRPEFAATRRSVVRNSSAKPTRLLVFMGGVDLPGITLPVLAAIENIGDHRLTVDCVIGSANPNAAKIRAWCGTRSWVVLHEGGADMAALSVAADLAIGAAGVSTWERCALGLPMALITIAENQRPGAEALAAMGGALYIGDSASLDPAALTAAIQTLVENRPLRHLLSEKAASLVDGRGAARVIAAMSGARLDLRRAVQTDSEAVWRWRNDEATRRYFHDPRAVALPDHSIWFAKAVAAQDRELLIGELDGQPIGVLRFDFDGAGLGGDRAEVSIYLVPGLTGKGLGAALLVAGNKWLSANHPQITCVDAQVLEANTASQQAFLDAGFTTQGVTYRYICAGGV